MSEQSPAGAQPPADAQGPADGRSPASRALPDAPNLDWLRKSAKRRLDQLRSEIPAAQLSDAQFELAKEYGFSSWRSLKAHVDATTVDGRIVDSARNGDADGLARLLDEYPDKLGLRTKPYGHSLLHVAATHGHLPVVDLLLRRGLDADTRDTGDDATAMHFAAGHGYLDVVRRLADAGGDVVGHGDDHALEVIGWATCFDECHEAVVEFLVERGARHHVFSAIAMNLAAEVRRIAAADPAAVDRPMSRNEDHRLPLHFAVQKNRPDMVTLLLELGADPASRDGSGFPAMSYATSPGADRQLLMVLRAGGAEDLFTVLALGDTVAAGRLLRDNPGLVRSGAANTGVLHLMAKRNDVPAVRWLLDNGADPNATWAHWDSDLAPLHLAAAGGHTEIVQLLLAAGADPRIRDTKHGGDAVGWATHHRRDAIVRILTEAIENSRP